MDPTHVLVVFMLLFFLKAPPSCVRIFRKRWRMSKNEIILLNVEDSSVMMRCLPILFAACAGMVQTYPGRMWWVDPRQATHWDIIEGVVWHVCPIYRDRKFIEAYRMPYFAFMYLVSELEPHVKSKYVRHVRAPIEPRKAIELAIYRLAHGTSAAEMKDRFGPGASTILKYLDIVVDALTDSNKLFAKYVFLPEGDRLTRIIEGFRVSCGLPNVCGAIDGCHIPLMSKPSKLLTTVPGDFYYSRKGFNSLVLQAICDMDKVFWNVCCSAPGGMADGGQFKISSISKQIHERSILSVPIVRLRRLDIQPYLLGDSGYPLRKYLLRNFKPPDGDAEKVRFDRKMNVGRVCIENAFGLLKGRWRILKRLNCVVDRAPRYITACTVLHNYCQLMNVVEPPTASIPVHVPIHGNIPVHREGRAALLSSEVLRNVLFDNFRGLPLPPLIPAHAPILGP